MLLCDIFRLIMLPVQMNSWSTFRHSQPVWQSIIPFRLIWKSKCKKFFKTVPFLPPLQVCNCLSTLLITAQTRVVHLQIPFYSFDNVNSHVLIESKGTATLHLIFLYQNNSRIIHITSFLYIYFFARKRIWKTQFVFINWRSCYLT